jgi:hypothetical protein
MRLSESVKPRSKTTMQPKDMSHTEIRVKGRTVSVPSVQIDGRTVITTGKWLKLAAVQDEDLVEGELVADPASFIRRLRESQRCGDIFTFVQKLPDCIPRYSYDMEWDNLAVIPITSFADWWNNRVEPSVRRAVRKSAKDGVVVREAVFDDAFVQGIVGINNETPVRQGKPFWHFHKSFEAVKIENSTYAERNTFLGAYYQDELIGFMRITYADKVANIVQLLSMMKHYDKRPANALLAKAVEICERNEMSYLMYYNYVYNDPKSSLTEFKRRNGFEQVFLPRYYVPLTPKGKVALRMGLHQGLTKKIPQPLLGQALKLRSLWYMRRLKASPGAL